MKKTIALLIIVLLAGYASGTEKPEYKSTIDYIQKTGRLWGVAEVSVNEDNSITLIDAESGYGSGLMMSLSTVQTSATLKVGETCSLSDGHHAFIKYEFKELQDGKITFFITDTFDARSFGDGIKKETKTLTITPYKKAIESQQKNPVAVILRHSGGWEIRINSDGGGDYGLGTTAARVGFKDGTFVFADVLADIKQVSSRTPKNAEGPSIAVSYWQKGQSSAEEHRIAEDKVLFEKLFKLAKANAIVPKDEPAKSEYEKVEKFWETHPPITPDKPNAGDSK